MTVRQTIAALAVAGATFGAAAPAQAVLPATGGGWTPTPPQNCSWVCMEGAWPKLYAAIENGQREMVAAGAEPTQRVNKANARLAAMSVDLQQLSAAQTSAIQEVGQSMVAAARRQ